MSLAVEEAETFNWLLTTEEGVQHKGHAVGGKSFTLPAKLPEGYHTTLTQGELRTACRIIVAPKRCYEPQALLAGQSCGAHAFSSTPCDQKRTGGLATLAISAPCW
jgi:4-alpha-glucanotransferase